MAELPQGYRDIPEADRKKAATFFERGRTVADTGNYDYAIEMYLQGLNIDPEALDAHKALREIAFKRKATGSAKNLGMIEAFKLKRGNKDDKQNLLNAEKLLAYDPGNTDHMLTMMQSAHRSGYYDTVLWIAPILMKANLDLKSPDFNKFAAIRDAMTGLKHWDLALQACQHCIALRPADPELQQKHKDILVWQTVDKGNYGEAGSFRNSVRDMDKQQALLQQDKDIQSTDFVGRQIASAEAEYLTDPNEPGKIMKFVDALERTEDPDQEERAVQVLHDAYQRTGQYRFRLRIGKLRMRQYERRERALREDLQENPADEQMKADYLQFKSEQLNFELSELREWVANYPTDMGLRFQLATRLFQLKKFDEAIPIFQHARSDPKVRIEGSLLLARSFLETQFVDEAIGILRDLVQEYQARDDAKSKEIYYWLARALELRGLNEEAIGFFSQLAQWDFNYRDVQAHIRKLRTAANG